MDFSRIDHCRDWLAYLLAFFALLRVREYTDGGLRMSEVVERSWGLSVTVPFSKTSIDPCTIPLVRRDDLLCPLAAYQAYMSLLPPYIRFNANNPLLVSCPLPAPPRTFSALVRVAQSNRDHVSSPPPSPGHGHVPRLLRSFVYFSPLPSLTFPPTVVNARPLSMTTFIAPITAKLRRRVGGGVGRALCLKLNQAEAHEEPSALRRPWNNLKRAIRNYCVWWLIDNLYNWTRQAYTPLSNLDPAYK